jgi:hypothetical protein
MTYEVQQKYAENWHRLLGKAKHHKQELTISRADYEQMVSRPCFYCKGTLPKRGTGIDRINSEVGYVKGNCRPCCTDCNLAKNDMTETEFKEWALRLFNHFITPGRSN